LRQTALKKRTGAPRRRGPGSKRKPWRRTRKLKPRAAAGPGESEGLSDFQHRQLPPPPPRLKQEASDLTLTGPRCYLPLRRSMPAPPPLGYEKYECQEATTYQRNHEQDRVPEEEGKDPCTGVMAPSWETSLPCPATRRSACHFGSRNDSHSRPDLDGEEGEQHEEAGQV
jgi:hypothetical protein